MNEGLSKKSLGNDIKELLIENLSIDKKAITEHTPLFSSGVLSSADLIDVLLILEESFSIRINPVNIKFENFDTIDMIAGFLLQSMSAEVRP